MRHRLKFQRGFEVGGVDAVIFDGVGGTHQFHLLQAGDGAVKGGLHLLREGAGKPGEIHFPGVLPHRLQKELVAGLLGKAHDLILDAGAVAGADALDGAAVEGAAPDILPNDRMGIFIGIANVAGQLIVQRCGVGSKGGGNGRLIPRLPLQFGKIDAAAVDTGGGTGFEAAQRNTQLPQAVAQAGGGVHPVGAGVLGIFADKYFTAEKGAGGQNDRPDRIDPAHRGGDRGDIPRSVGINGDDLRLAYR